MKHDYQCNAAMSLIKRYQLETADGIRVKNPREVSQTIVSNIPSNLFLMSVIQ